MPKPKKKDTREIAGSIRAGKNKRGLCHVNTHRPRVIKISTAPYRTVKKTNSARAIQTSTVHTENAVLCRTRSHTPCPPWQLGGRPAPSEQRRLPLSLALAPPPPHTHTRLSPQRALTTARPPSPRPGPGLARPASQPPAAHLATDPGALRCAPQPRAAAPAARSPKPAWPRCPAAPALPAREGALPVRAAAARSQGRFP
jgi:hypothetical protein